VDNGYSPNPFDIVATVLNNGTAPAIDTSLILEFPAGLSLVEGDALQTIGDLSVGQERQVSWKVHADNQSSATTLMYSVLASARNAAIKTVTREITLPAVQLPLIVIPGIAGSELKLGTPMLPDMQLWPGLGTDHRSLSLYPSDDPYSSIYASDIIRHTGVLPVYAPLLNVLQRSGYQEYKVDGIPARRTMAGCDMGQRLNNPNLFVFAYDWRLDNAQNAKALKEYVGCVQQFYPNTKVNIVAHSMRGLLARRYILDHAAGHDVNALITIASPWLGAPKALNVLETGEFLDPYQHAFVVQKQTLKYVAGSFKGAHQLLPSRAYVELSGLAPLVEDGWDWDGDDNGYEEYSYENMVNLLDSRYGREGFQRGTTSDSFHSAAGQDDWRFDTTGTKYYHIYGDTGTDETIVQVTALTTVECTWVFVQCDAVERFKPDYGRGDETVPITSSTRLTSLGNYNAPNVKPVQPATDEGTPIGDNTHTGIVANPAVHEMVLEYLADSVDSHDSVPGIQSFSDQEPDTAPMLPSRPAYYVTFDGGTEVVVSDSLGNSTAPISDTFRGVVPGVTIDSLGDDAESIVLDPTQSYTVTFRTTGAPLFLEVRQGTGTTTSHVVRYIDKELPTGVTARLKLTPQGIETLRYDVDSDGTFDSVITPTVDVSGARANDRERPVITASQRAQEGQVLVTLISQDTGAGVQALYYSLDGTQFQPYTTPITVDPAAVPTMYAFADDQVGNRSSLFQTTIAAENSAPTVGVINASVDPIAVNTQVAASATFTDTDTNDTHTAVWDWGDGSTSEGTIEAIQGSGTVQDSHTYTAAGVYTVKLTVTDQADSSATSTFQYIVVYDPSAGFVTGGSWITSPLGAFTADPARTGKASFGFTARYKKGATTPDGQTQFSFHAADLSFKSSSYQWLVVSGAKAQYKGVGTINGSGDYGFLVTLTDGQHSGGGGTDRFRIKIWDTATGAVVYDNQVGAADDATATTALAGGTIVIHKK
jgi:PKD repeat protein